MFATYILFLFDKSFPCKFLWHREAGILWSEWTFPDAGGRGQRKAWHWPSRGSKEISFCTGSLWYVRGVSMIFLTLERRRYFSFDDHSRIRLKRFCVDFQRIALTQVQVLRKNERKLGCAKISANKVFQRYSCFKSFKTIVKFEVFKTRGKVKRNNKR